MPIPKPKKNESKDDYISRCMEEMNKRDPNRSQSQIAAICNDKWRKS